MSFETPFLDLVFVIYFFVKMVDVGTHSKSIGRLNQTNKSTKWRTLAGKENYVMLSDRINKIKYMLKRRMD